MGGGTEEVEGERAVVKGGNIWNKPPPNNLTTVAIETIQLQRRKHFVAKNFQKNYTYFSCCRDNYKEFPDVELVSYEIIFSDKEFG